MTDAAAVTTSNLTKRFGAVEALHDVTFDVRQSELFGFVGPDGAGKTTLFRILTTLMLPDTGSATVLGLDVRRDLWAVRMRVGYMPGRFSLYPDLTVAENLEFFAAVFGTTVEEGYETIAPIYRQIEPFRGRRAAALSGGMKQKLALSCALVHRPELLLLDEPTTGVDAVSRRELWDLLADLKAGGLTIVVSTPYMDEASRCDRVALIQKGRILQIDAPAVITANYGRPLVAVRAADRRGALAALRAYPHVLTAYPFGQDIHYTDARFGKDAAELSEELRVYLESRQVRDVAIRPVAAEIEDSFMALMGSVPSEAVA